jgi:hypothetical protein
MIPQDKALEYLRGVNLMIALPCYGQMMSMHTARGLIDLARVAQEIKMQVSYAYLGNESLITRGRNQLTHDFLKGGYSHLMFIDADIGFESGRPIIQMLLHDLDVIGGAYPIKGIGWAGAIRAHKMNPSATDADFAMAAGVFACDFLDSSVRMKTNEPVPVRHIGTGFLQIKRGVFERLLEGKLIPSSIEPMHGERVNKFWQTGPNDEDEEMSEDYYFCYLCRKLGIKIHLLPDVILSHVGAYIFQGSIRASTCSIASDTAAL